MKVKSNMYIGVLLCIPGWLRQVGLGIQRVAGTPGWRPGCYSSAHTTHTNDIRSLNHNNTFFFFGLRGRAVDPHSFFADSDPAVFLNEDPDPAA